MNCLILDPISPPLCFGPRCSFHCLDQSLPTSHFAGLLGHSDQARSRCSSRRVGSLQSTPAPIRPIACAARAPKTVSKSGPGSTSLIPHSNVRYLYIPGNRHRAGRTRPFFTIESGPSQISSSGILTRPLGTRSNSAGEYPIHLFNLSLTIYSLQVFIDGISQLENPHGRVKPEQYQSYNIPKPLTSTRRLKRP